MSLKVRKRLFFCLMLIAFLAVTIYEFLTPNMSDDLVYLDEVVKAKNVFDLFGQEVEHWLVHTGRSVAHFMLRIFLYTGHKGIFNVVAAAVFVLMSVLIYLNVDRKKEYDVRLYGVILVLLWFFDAAIGDTVFWEDGACNYMFTTTIIMGFITLFRLSVKNEKSGTGLSVAMLILGIAAGWCNENTSGGLILFILLEFVYLWIRNGKSFKFIRPYMITGFVGSLIGFALLILSPGNFGRLEITEEEHTGLLAFMARFLKITLIIKNNYFVLVAAFAVIIVLILYCYGKEKAPKEDLLVMALFGVLFLATCYALIMVPSSEIRSYYGASIFLMTGIAEGIGVLSELKDKLLQGALAGIVVVYGLLFVLGYFEDGANLARIKREYDERDAYLTEIAAAGGWDVTAPMLRPQWETRFSKGYDTDLHEDWQYWINSMTAVHYGLGSISGVPREEWTEY